MKVGNRAKIPECELGPRWIPGDTGAAQEHRVRHGLEEVIPALILFPSLKLQGLHVPPCFVMQLFLTPARLSSINSEDRALAWATGWSWK